MFLRKNLDPQAGNTDNLTAPNEFFKLRMGHKLLIGHFRTVFAREAGIISKLEGDRILGGTHGVLTTRHHWKRVFGEKRGVLFNQIEILEDGALFDSLVVQTSLLSPK